MGDKKQKRIKVWCEKRPVRLRDISDHGNHRSDMPKPTLYRCPKCKKRVKTYVKGCNDISDLSGISCCWHEYMPPHKRLITA